MNDAMPPPSPTIGNARFRIAAKLSPSSANDVPGPVEAAIAQDDAVELVRSDNASFEVADRSDRLLRVARRVRVERRLFVLHRRTLAREGPARIALCDELSGPDRQRGGEQVVRSLCAKPVRPSERLVELPEAATDAAERGRLVDDDLGLRLRNRPADGFGVQHVEDDRLRAEGSEGCQLLG
jgi:hypothetical protein